MLAMKQVIVVNQALKLPVGKLAAQVAHAALGAFLAANHEAQIVWLQARMPKVVVYLHTPIDIPDYSVVCSLHS